MILHVPEVTPDDDILSAALKYAAAGWYVGPTSPTDRKNPGSVLGKGWQSKTSRDVEQIVAWFSGTRYLLFGHCGRSGAWVADVDRPDLVPAVLVQAIESRQPPHQSSRPDQPRRGHYPFLQPTGRMIGNGTGRLGKDWGEGRGRNGVIMLTPSSHRDEANGARYEWLQTGPVPEMTPELADALPDATAVGYAATDAEVRRFLTAHAAATSPRTVQGQLTKFAELLAAGGSRHGALVEVAPWAAREAMAGRFSAADAFEVLTAAFVTAMATSRDGKERRISASSARAEAGGVFAWAVAQAELEGVESVRARMAASSARSFDDFVDPPAHRPEHIQSVGKPPRADQQPTGEQPEPTAPDQAPTAAMPQPAAGLLVLPILPPEFWTSRPPLDHIRRAAHARLCSADVVLHAVLARLAGMVSHKLTFDSGRGESSLNYFAIAMGPSGTGKSTSARTARSLIATPAYLQPTPGELDVWFLDGVPIGSGEGVAESFMGTREVEIGEKPGGTPIMKRVRMQVRHNAFLVADEGEALLKIGERSGATIGATLRSAWGGETLGQMNASEDRTRLVPADTYALGLLVGLQPATALPLLLDTGAGMAQRFILASAVDTSIPDEPIPFPGQLGVALNQEGWINTAATGCIPFPAEVMAELRRAHLARARGESVADEQDSQSALMRCKVAALLALLDNRFAVEVSDWELAEIVWKTSCAVRDAIIEHGRVEEARAAEQRAQTRVQLEERIAAVTTQVDGKLLRLARSLAKSVIERGGLTHGAARRTLRSDSRPLYESVVEVAAGQGWVVEGAAGLTAPLHAVS